MAVITSQLVAPTSASIEKIQKYEKGVVELLGKDIFKVSAPYDSRVLCSSIVAYLRKDATEQQMAALNTIFPKGQGLETISEICLKLRQVFNLGIKGSEECVDEIETFEKEIITTFESEMDNAIRYSIDNRDLESLKKFKPFLNENSLDYARARYANSKLDRYKAMVDWMEAEFKLEPKP